MTAENLHRLSLVTTIATWFLLGAGALVTSTGSGLAVPDWPLSYGQFFPKMEGGVLFEHGHRIVAGFVAILTAVQAACFYFYERRKWVRALAIMGFALVLFQALLGGLTVLMQLPAKVSVLHACTAQVFFALNATILTVTSKNWELPISIKTPDVSRFFIILSAAFFLQILIGALMRHSGAGLAIADFSLSFTKLIPDFSSFAIRIHFLHRVLAYSLLLFVFYGAIIVYRTAEERLVFWSGVLVALVLLQAMLGAFVVILKKPVWMTMLHLQIGALCFATSVSLSVRTLKGARLFRRAEVFSA